MADFEIKENDLLPSITYQLQDAAGNIDLTGSSVKFIMSAQLGVTNKVDAAATIVTPASGIVRYDWTGTDTDTPNDPDDPNDAYFAEWEITFPSTKKLTVPNDGYITVRIIPDLNSEVE